jgi:hypothetical protein
MPTRPPDHRRDNGPDRVDHAQVVQVDLSAKGLGVHLQEVARLGTSSCWHEDVAIAVACAGSVDGGPQRVASGDVGGLGDHVVAQPGPRSGQLGWVAGQDRHPCPETHGAGRDGQPDSLGPARDQHM